MKSNRTFDMVRGLMLAVSGLIVALCFSSRAQAEATVVAVVQDYAQQAPDEARPAMLQWNWSDEQKANAVQFSTRQIVEHEGRTALQLTVNEGVPWVKRDSLAALNLGIDLLPPTVDALRIHYKLLSGQIELSFGSPTVYFGHSDVQSTPLRLYDDGTTSWRMAEVSLFDGMIRNFRRAGFARESPVVYYTRWIQEPLYLYLHQGSNGSLLIDRIELLATGRGKPYPTFEADEVEVLATLGEYDGQQDVGRVFTATHAKTDLTGEPRRARKAWGPPQISHVAEAEDDRRGVLKVEHQGAEEVAFTGIETTPPTGANAIAFDLRVSHPTDFDELSVDLLIYAAPRDGGFAIERFAPPVRWRDHKDVAFDAYLTADTLDEVDYAFYHTRRAAPNGQWTRWVVPLADFVCVYGHGAMRSAMMRQEPIDPAKIVAIGWLPSWRQHKFVTTFEIDQVQWVRVPGSSAELTSFAQIPDIAAIRLETWRDPSYGGTRRMVIETRQNHAE